MTIPILLLKRITHIQNTKFNTCMDLKDKHEEFALFIPKYIKTMNRACNRTFLFFAIFC